MGVLSLEEVVNRYGVVAGHRGVVLAMHGQIVSLYVVQKACRHRSGTSLITRFVLGCGCHHHICTAYLARAVWPCTPLSYNVVH